MVRIIASNGRSLSKIRIMLSAIVSNRMVCTGIMSLRHSRIIAAVASSVTAGLQMLAMDFCFMSLLFLRVYDYPFGICFPDFTGLRLPDCPFVSRLGERKYRSVARMIFFLSTSPQGCLAHSVRQTAIFAARNGNA